MTDTLEREIPEYTREVADTDEDLLFAVGFDDCIAGVVQRCGMESVLCYDVEKCLQNLMTREPGSLGA